MSRRKHIHKYHRITLKFGQVWACALPTCSHYMPNGFAPTLPGKASICWGCGKEFILDDNNMQDEKPRCNECNPVIVDMSEVLEKFGIK